MYIYGASGHAKVIIDILHSVGGTIDGLFDDDDQVTSLSGINVNHGWKGEEPIIISIGNNRIRKKVAEKLCCQFSKAIHSTAILSPSVNIGDGSVVMAGSIINADTVIGKHCIINTGARIDHECMIGDYVHISPNSTLCGNVHIGDGAWIGAGAVVIPGVKIGKWCTIGAGAVVIKDVPDNVVVAGVPAKVIRINS